MEGPLTAALLLGFTALLVFLVYGVLRLLFALVGAVSSAFNGITPADRVLLAVHLPYYAQLTVRQQRSFERRVSAFIEDKEFHGRGLEITREVRLRIAATAVQLTFGFRPLLLMHFTQVVVYADKFRNRTQAAEHIGEVNPGFRVIAVSWQHFVAGFENPNDARNVGLHEMAHALWLENGIPNEEDDFLDATALRTWRSLASTEAARINAGERRFFRPYAGTDQAEFFAVAVEYFFEQPTAYCQALPELYTCMVRLLKQDPALQMDL